MENKPVVKSSIKVKQRGWQIVPPVALALFLAACSSGIDTTPQDLGPTASDSVKRQLRSTSDDAEEASSGSIRTGSAAQDLDFSYPGQRVGMRFSSLSIPQGAKITKAYVRFKASASDSGSTTLSIRAHDTDSASSFSTSKRNISSRSTTSASERWSPSSWRKGSSYSSDDISEVVQEVVNRRGWDSGNALALIVTGDSSSTRRRAVSANRSLGDSPTLYVSYESSRSGGGSDEPTAPSGNVSSSQREWHKRLMKTIDSPRYKQSSLDPKKLAATGDVYKIGRFLNLNETSIILAYRETGDRDLVRHLDKIMDIARDELRDTNGDGYKNWTHKTRTDSSSNKLLGTDKHEMNEIMTHGFVASAAYTLKQAGYSSSAKFWTDYLKNDFEAKWRKRSGRRSSFPFIDHGLMHPTVNMIRYHYYMYKLTGDSDYYKEAKRLASKVKGTMRSSDGGYVWSHRVGSRSGCQPITYVKYTTSALADLATVSSSLFDSSFMKRVARTMANKALKSSSGTKLASNICGSGSYGSVSTFNEYPYAQLAPWDSSGKLETAAERAYAAVERHSMSSPRTSNIPAIMVFAKGR